MYVDPTYSAVGSLCCHRVHRKSPGETRRKRKNSFEYGNEAAQSTKPESVASCWTSTCSSFHSSVASRLVRHPSGLRVIQNLLCARTVTGRLHARIARKRYVDLNFPEPRISTVFLPAGSSALDLARDAQELAGFHHVHTVSSSKDQLPQA